MAGTSPSWTPLFATVGALVTDTGGPLSHAAVVAREFSLPAVVGTHVATQALRDGQTVEVDGDHGIIRLLEPSATDSTAPALGIRANGTRTRYAREPAYAVECHAGP